MFISVSGNLLIISAKVCAFITVLPFSTIFALIVYSIPISSLYVLNFIVLSNVCINIPSNIVSLLDDIPFITELIAFSN